MNIKTITLSILMGSSIPLCICGHMPMRQRPSNKDNLTQEQLNAAWKKTRVDVPLSFDPPPRATKEDIKGEMPKEHKKIFKAVKSIQNGGRYSSGLLFIGPPGVGKTLTAQALSGTLQGRSVHVMARDIIDLDKKGSDSGKGIHDIFERTRKHVELTEQWVIIFIDEVHYFHFVGGGQAPNMESAIMALRYEMAEERNNKNIIVIVATNQAIDNIDGFFTTSTYFRKVDFPLPDKKNRLAILQHYFGLGKYGLKKGVTLDRVAKATEGFSVRKLKELIILVEIEASNKPIDYKHIDEALRSYGRKLPWSNWDKAAYVVETTSKGTAGGSVIGTVASPGPGTIIGAGVGALGGFVLGLCIALENS